MSLICCSFFADHVLILLVVLLDSSSGFAITTFETRIMFHDLHSSNSVRTVI